MSASVPLRDQGPSTHYFLTMPAHKYFFLDPDVRHISAAQFKEAQTAVDSNQYRDGDIVEAWDHVFRWTSDCAPLSKWEEWRFEGDDVADAALPFIQGSAGDSGGTDLLSRLESIANGPSAEPAVMKMWQHLHEDIYQKLDTNKEQIARGQAVFYRYAPQILASLLHYSQGCQTDALRYVVYDVVAPYPPYVRSPLCNRTVYRTVVEALIILQ